MMRYFSTIETPSSLLDSFTKSSQEQLFLIDYSDADYIANE
jgi:hypothetical protein